MGKPEPIGAVGFRGFIAFFLTAMVLVVVLLTCLLVLPKFDEVKARQLCSDYGSEFRPFPTDQKGDVVLTNYSYIIRDSFTGNSLRISDRATLVVADGKDITLQFKYILIEGSGALLAGNENCRFRSKLNIQLVGGRTDPENIQSFGRKFIGVGPYGRLELQGINKLSWTYLMKTLNPSAVGPVIVDLADDAVGWTVGDKIVVSSSDYDMTHAEELTLVACPECKLNQVKTNGPVRYRHLGGNETEQVDMRAEVGLLTRNIKISGVMSTGCTYNCAIYNYDTFGGQIKIMKDAASVRLDGVELENMGQLGGSSANPVTFHRVFDAKNHYVRKVSIHKSYSRCVAIEATQNLVVEDVVGYDAIGHCFYLGESTEQNITLRHNLGLVTRSGTQFPSERGALACATLSSNFSGRLPNFDKECNGVSTFFITHPNNILEDNAAAGSESTGYSYAFYRQPVGLSSALLAPYQSERSPLLKFSKNRAHSNAKAGLSLGRGVKITQPSAENPADYLSLNDDAQFAPHVNGDLQQPRSPAKISSFTSYRNGLGVFVRGGDVFIEDAKLSDNDVGVIMASSETLPYDVGSQQRFMNSVVIGRSAMNDTTWLNRSVPSVGVELTNGPVLVRDVQFMNFMTTDQRLSYAIGFVPKNNGQLSVKNTIGYCDFLNVDQKIFLGRKNTDYWGAYDKDGDLFQIVQDLTGSITGLQASYIIRDDVPLLHRSACQLLNAQNITFCPPESYGQLFVNATTKAAVLQLVEVHDMTSVVSLRGVDREDPTKPNSNQYQMTLEADGLYRIFWTDDKVPTRIELSMYNFHLFDNLYLELCYPPNTTFTVTGRQWDQLTGSTISSSELLPAPNLQFLQQSSSQVYYWNETSRLLSLKLINGGQAIDSNYCPDDGCRTVIINADITDNQPFFDCF